MGDIVLYLITFFVPNCLFNKISSAKTFDLCAGNKSDHLPIMVKLNQRDFPECTTTVSDDCCIASGKIKKYSGQNFPRRKYTRNMSYHCSVICQRLTCVI